MPRLRLRRVTVTASVQGELPAGIDVSDVMAAVSVLPRELRLSLPSSPLLVLSGLNTSVELTLLGAASLTATESVEVSLVGLSDSGFSVDPSSLLMGQSTPSTSLSLMVPRELESAELTAEASSLPVNAEVSSTSVGIRVLPREYVLSFSPPALPIVAGTTGSATLSLEGAYGLLSEESVTVSLSVAGAVVEGILVSPVEVTFDKVSTSVEVEVEVLSSVVAATTRLLASVSSKPAWVAVSDTTLPVSHFHALSVWRSWTCRAMRRRRGCPLRKVSRWRSACRWWGRNWVRANPWRYGWACRPRVRARAWSGEIC